MTTAEKITLGFHGAEAVAVVVFFAFMAWAVNSTRQRINQAELQTVSATAQTLTSIQRAVDADNTSVAKTLKQSEATLAAIQQTSESATRTLDQISADSHHEIMAFAETTNAATETAQDASQTLRTANRTIAGFQPITANLDAELGDLQRTTMAINQQVSSAQVAGTLANIQTTTANLAGVTTDFKTKFHALLYPTPCKTKWCKLKRAWPYIRGATEMTEPLYWGVQIYKGATP